MKQKITIDIDEITSRHGGQLAAEKSVGYRDYLASLLEEAVRERAAMLATEEKATVTLEIDDELYFDLVYVSGDYFDHEAAAKHFVTEMVERKWGDRGC